MIPVQFSYSQLGAHSTMPPKSSSPRADNGSLTLYISSTSLLGGCRVRQPSRRTAGDGTGVGGGTTAAGGGTSAAGGAVSWSISRLARGGCPAPDSGLAGVAAWVGLGRGDTGSAGWVGVSGSMGDGGMVVARGMTDGELIKGALAICGVYWRRCFLLRSVTRPDPSTRMTYWSYCRTSTTIPVRSHLVGCGPTRFCSLTQLPITSGGRTVCVLRQSLMCPHVSET